MNKNIARLRRAKSTRAHIRELGVPRLSVLRTGQHLYAQVFTADGSKVLASALLLTILRRSVRPLELSRN